MWGLPPKPHGTATGYSVQIIVYNSTMNNIVCRMMVRVLIRTAKVERELALRNWSQTEFARQVEVSRPFMSQLLSGQRCASPRIRRRILGALPNCDFDDLFAFKNGAGKR